MKKIIIIIFCILFITGCTNINNLSFDEIIESFSANVQVANIYRTGYKYNLPDGFSVMDSSEFNEVLKDEYNTYYLYVDIVSYYNKTNWKYEKNKKAIYSTPISYNHKNGYVEINLVENEKYLVEIMYNYAKIEVIVDKDNCNKAMLSSISILRSVIYNDDIVSNILGDNILSFSEEEFDIFRTHGNDDDYIQIEDEIENEDYQEIDTDLIY